MSELTVFNNECSLTKERQSYQGDFLSVLWLTCSLTKAEVLNSPQYRLHIKISLMHWVKEKISLTLILPFLHF